ncbi:unnamed protein product [Adineta ricciae]|uniref:G-protein coupled receptors family 1 profile domain-containing protein n=1 Tax=Adineta ricciae TaxID=249248 RepID=A0A815AFA5_ADIRI|nr:unnamed protein product [Adineta ricciae]CAF1414985.1 unnamed protein product [Adineta ricciae]
MSLVYDAQQFTLYVGYFLLFAGVIGNGINILIFTKVRVYRTTSCTFYFLIGSIDNILYILFNVTLRILGVGYNINVTDRSSAWCKARQYLIVVPAVLSIGCSCLATADQFFITSRNASLRRCGDIGWAHRIIIIAIILSFLHGIPVLLFFDISPISNNCLNLSAGYRIYQLVYLIGVICLIPVLIMIIFGWLTYHNIHQTMNLAELQVDRQLIRMTLIHVILVTISLLPYGIYTTYSLLTSSIVKNYDRQFQEYLASSILSLVTYFYNAVCESIFC